jgi:hypothetical protein
MVRGFRANHGIEVRQSFAAAFPVQPEVLRQFVSDSGGRKGLGRSKVQHRFHFVKPVGFISQLVFDNPLLLIILLYLKFNSMMRNLIAAIVAGVLIMVWQTASHTFLELHAEQEKYTPKHAAILQVLTDSLKEEGMYFLPGVPHGRNAEDAGGHDGQALGPDQLSQQPANRYDQQYFAWPRYQYHRCIRTGLVVGQNEEPLFCFYFSGLCLHRVHWILYASLSRIHLVPHAGHPY